MNRAAAVHNPFVGLRPFESRDSIYYFGRKEQTHALLRQLYAHRFVAVVGSSGCGKSSLVRAGLIPNLEAGFLVQDRDLWEIATFKPGDAPLYHLVACRGFPDRVSKSLRCRRILNGNGSTPGGASAYRAGSVYSQW